jgi:CheY-like chemotaxis protein
VLGRLQAAVALVVERASARDRVRAWVPACKTGGLAYAVAMLLSEAVADAGSGQRVHVFGTDADEEALAVARAGRYPQRAAAGVDARLRDQYLIEEEATASVRVADALREACFFSSLKLPRHAPFSRLDLVVCQRVFEAVCTSQRDAVVSELSGALRDEGVLFTFDHVQHFQNGCFELSPAGHLQPRPATARARSSPALPRSARPAPAGDAVSSAARDEGTPPARSTPPALPHTVPPALAAAKPDLELTVEAIGMPLLLLDDQLRVLHLSGAALQRFGLSPADRHLPLEALVAQLPGRRELLHAAERALETGLTGELALDAGARSYLVRVSVGQRAARRLVALLFSDVSALEVAADRALLHRHQQAAVARLGELALGSCRLQALCEEALSLLSADIPVCRAGLIVECTRDVPPLSVVASRGLGLDPIGALRTTGAAYELVQRVVERVGAGREPLERAEVWSVEPLAAGRRSEPDVGAWAFGSPRPLEGGAAWPIVNEGVLLGVIALYSARVGIDAAELQRFVQAVAHVLAGAIARERTRERLELEREVDAVAAVAADPAALGHGLLPALGTALAADAVEVWWAAPELACGWQQHFPERGLATRAPPWPAELLGHGGPLYRPAVGPERPNELWIPVPSRTGVTAMLRASGRALRAPHRELEAGLEASARRLALFFERSRAQREVRLSEAARRQALAELEALCESLPVGISVHDRSGAVRHGLHFSPEPWLARLYGEELPPWVARVIDTGESIQDLVLSVASGAERRSWSCSIRSLRDEGGAPSGAIVVLHDPADSSPATAATRTRHRSSIAPRRWRVSIISDDADTSIALAALFDPLQFAVELATRIDDAVLQSFHSTHDSPDLIVCDIDSAVIDWGRLSEQVRAAGGAGQLGLIALTREGGALTRLRIEEAGFDDFLTHPVKPDALLQCLSRLSAAPAFRYHGG